MKTNSPVSNKGLYSGKSRDENVMRRLAKPLKEKYFEGCDPITYISQIPEIEADAKAKGVYDLITNKTSLKKLSGVDAAAYIDEKTKDFEEGVHPVADIPVAP